MAREAAWNDGPRELQYKILEALVGSDGSGGIAQAVGGGGSSSSFATAAQIKVTTAGTRVQGSNVSTPRGVIISANPNNAGLIYVGDSAVTKGSGTFNGIILAPGGFSPVIPVSNLNQIYIDADNNNDFGSPVIQ